MTVWRMTTLLSSTVVRVAACNNPECFVDVPSYARDALWRAGERLAIRVLEETEDASVVAAEECTRHEYDGEDDVSVCILQGYALHADANTTVVSCGGLLVRVPILTPPPTANQLLRILVTRIPTEDARPPRVHK